MKGRKPFLCSTHAALNKDKFEGESGKNFLLFLEKRIKEKKEKKQRCVNVPTLCKVRGGRPLKSMKGRVRVSTDVFRGSHLAPNQGQCE